MRVCMHFPEPVSDRNFIRLVEMPAVPRVGEVVYIAHNDDTLAVSAVHWTIDADGTPAACNAPCVLLARVES